MRAKWGGRMSLTRKWNSPDKQTDNEVGQAATDHEQEQEPTPPRDVNQLPLLSHSSLRGSDVSFSTTRVGLLESN